MEKLPPEIRLRLLDLTTHDSINSLLALGSVDRLFYGVFLNNSSRLYKKFLRAFVPEEHIEACRVLSGLPELKRTSPMEPCECWDEEDVDTHNKAWQFLILVSSEADLGSLAHFSVPEMVQMIKTHARVNYLSTILATCDALEAVPELAIPLDYSIRADRFLEVPFTSAVYSSLVRHHCTFAKGGALLRMSQAGATWLDFQDRRRIDMLLSKTIIRYLGPPALMHSPQNGAHSPMHQHHLSTWVRLKGPDDDGMPLHSTSWSGLLEFLENSTLRTFVRFLAESNVEERNKIFWGVNKEAEEHRHYVWPEHTGL